MHKSFTLKYQKELPDISSQGFMFIHKKTGAQVLYIKNEDRDKTFGIAFKTIPTDDTGVAHILEHSVLNGSEKYPVKEPFTFLMKSSLSTFLNALTYPDKTIYPVSSTNQQDLKNLSSVYLDAVFKPLLIKDVFLQEGWHYELFNEQDPIKYKGVVFNEMKGSLANIDHFTANLVYKHLLKGTVYDVNSGGDPGAIPDLTYKAFIDFHKTFYHPTNSMSILYGDMDPVPFLELLDSYFSQFPKKDSKNTFKRLTPFIKPKVVNEVYPSSDSKAKYVSVLATAFDKPDARDFFGLAVLSYLLTDSDASPLKRVLRDSELGESIFDYGVENELYTNLFIIGLKGIAEKKDILKVEKIILGKLRELSKGVDKAALLGAISRVEFMLRAGNGEEKSKGVSAFTVALRNWLYNEDPCEIFDFSEHFDYFKTKAIEDNYFEKLIAKYISTNNNLVKLRISPDKNYFVKRDTREKLRLARFKKSLSKNQISKLVSQNTKLKELQETPDSKEALAKLPVLALSDIPKEAISYPLEVVKASQINGEVTYTAIPPKGLINANILFDTASLSRDELPYLGLYKLLILQLGTKTKSPEELTILFESVAGELDTKLFFTKNIQTNEIVQKFVLSVSFLEEKSSGVADLLKELLIEVNFDNLSQIKKIIKEEKDTHEIKIVDRGFKFAVINAMSSLHEQYALGELTAGLSFYLFLKTLMLSSDKSLQETAQRLKAIHAKIITNSGELNFSSSLEKKLPTISAFAELFNKLPKTPTHSKSVITLPSIVRRGFIIPSQVNYVALATNLYKKTGLVGGKTSLLDVIAKYDYMWNELRVKGGAYGGMSYLSEQGLLGLCSYRDPNLEKTLKTFENYGSYMQDLKLEKTQLAGYKIGALSNFEPYVSDNNLGFEAYGLYKAGHTVELRQKYKDELLTLTQKDINNFGSKVGKISYITNPVTVIGSNDSIAGFKNFDEVLPLF